MIAAQRSDSQSNALTRSAIRAHYLYVAPLCVTDVRSCWVFIERVTGHFHFELSQRFDVVRPKNIWYIYFGFGLWLRPLSSPSNTCPQRWQKINQTFITFGLLGSLWLHVDEQTYWPLIHRDYFKQSVGSSLRMNKNRTRQRRRRLPLWTRLRSNELQSKQSPWPCRNCWICPTSTKNVFLKHFKNTPIKQSSSRI